MNVGNILSNKEPLDRLIANLNTLKQHPKLEAFSNVYKGKKWITTTLPEGESHSPNDKDIIDLIDQIDSDLCGYLINAQGQHHTSNRMYIRDHGFRFEKGECDDFGPLTSVIVIGDYRFCYG